jgi:integrase
VTSYGQYPDISLSEVKSKYQVTCKLIANGTDPMELKKDLAHQKELENKEIRDKKLLHEKYTFKKMAIEWHKLKSPEWSVKHRHEVMSSLERFMFKKLGNMSMAEITRHDVMIVLKEIEQRPSPPLTALRKVRQRVEAVFWYVIDTYQIIDNNPASNIKSTSFKKVPVQNLRALDKEDIPELMKAIDSYNGYMTSKLATKMLVYTFTRHSELRLAKWGEIDFDNRLWHVPKIRMKRDKELVVPLSNQVIDILEELQSINGEYDFIFASHHKPEKQPISENAILLLLKNIGFWQKTTAHGFRSTFSTIANDEQINPDWIELQLAHSTGNKVRAAYNRSEYLPQRTIMMQWYANYIDGDRTDFDE